MGMVCAMKTKCISKTLFTRTGQMWSTGHRLPTPGLNHKDTEFKDKHN